jgi:hypothetical protein
MAASFEGEMLDQAARIGVQAKFEGVKKAQFENLMASLDAIEDEKKSLLLTALYAHRQAERLGGRRTAILISQALNQLHAQGRRREDARKLLGLAKWVFESVERTRLDIEPRQINNLTIEKLIQMLGGTRSP